MRYGWTLKKQEWDILPQVVDGTHWSKTKLEQLYQDDVPKSTGVYVICVNMSHLNQALFKSLYNVIYVGKSDKGTLHDRFLSHCRNPSENIAMAKQCFGNNLEYWFAEVNSDKVAELEARLIECFGPPANRRRGRILMKVSSPRPA